MLHYISLYLNVSQDMQDCKCNLHLATWTGCLISSLLFSLVVSVVISGSSDSLQTQWTSRWPLLMPHSISVSTGYSIILTAKI